jgi:integrase
MARTLKDDNIGTREARERLKPRGKPYYRQIEPGLHLGYRKAKGRKGVPAVAGKWCLRHYVGSQSYIVETIATADDFSDADGTAILSFKQALTLARERMVHRAHDAAGKTGPLTVRAAVESYLEWLESNRKSAYDAGRRAEAFIYPKLGDTECEAVTTDILRKWHAGLAKEAPRMRTKPGAKQRHRAFNGDEDAVRRRRSSANRVLTILKAALNRAWREGKLSTDTSWRRVEPFENVDAARVHYLKIAEAQRLVNASDPEFRPLVQAALQTGARYGELIRLQVHDFNRDAGTLAIRQSKSGKPRHVVLTDEGIALFRQPSAGQSGHNLLLRRASGEPWGPSHQGRPMADACERAKIKPAISFHGLRHTWASLAVMNGVPLLVVAKNLGHADTRMVERHYGHLAPSYVADAIRAGAPRFGFKPDKKVSPIRATG